MSKLEIVAPGENKAPSSRQFTKLTDGGRIAFDGFMAVYRNDGDHVILAAPNIDQLAMFWEKTTGVPLKKDQAQHVHIIAAK